jgi:hypothetical protein
MINRSDMDSYETATSGANFSFLFALVTETLMLLITCETRLSHLPLGSVNAKSFVHALGREPSVSSRRVERGVDLMKLFGDATEDFDLWKGHFLSCSF